jgi:hypothetical protein
MKLDVLKETWKYLVGRFWWLRGAAAALTLTALVPEFVNLSRYEFLRALHAVIVGWHVVAEKLSYLIGQIPYLPRISADVVSTIIFSATVCIPLIFAHLKSDIQHHRQILTITVFRVILYSILIPYIYYAIITDGASSLFSSETMRIFGLVVFGLGVLVSVYFAAMVLPGFWRGLVYVGSFIVAFEILYLLQTPWITEQVNEFVCEVSPENCLPIK